jgi:hypothetical protein
MNIPFTKNNEHVADSFITDKKQVILMKKTQDLATQQGLSSGLSNS